MQTFLTRRKHMATAADLDAARLNKQRLEVQQILNHLLRDAPIAGNPYPYQMWAGWEGHLAFYGMCVCHEWGQRGNSDSLMAWFKEIVDGTPDYQDRPPWLDDLWLLRSHRSRLVEKAPHYYDEKFPNTPANMPYLWPVNEGSGYRLRLAGVDVGRLRTGERVLPPGFVLDGPDVVEMPP